MALRDCSSCKNHCVGSVPMNSQFTPFRDEYFEMDKNTLLTEIEKEKFFHDMVVGETRTRSWVYEDHSPPNYHLWPLLRYLGELDISGKTCLDIGSFDGMSAFVLAERGAAHVDATCQYDLKRFRLMRALRRYEQVAYHPNTDLGKIARSFASARYDLVIISAMLHHLTAPLDALLETRRLLKPNGAFLLETIFIDDPSPALLLNTELADPIFGAPTLFAPTLPAARGMLQLAGFEIESETRLLGGGAARETNHERVTFLARARKASQIAARTKKTIEIHESAPKLGPIDFTALEHDETPLSEIRYSGPEGSRTLNIWIDTVDSPLQPQARMHPSNVRTCFIAGAENHFLTLASCIPDGAFTWEDVHLLGARYPAEIMPDGMQWGLKQLGCLHVLDYVRKLGLARVLEIGPGFNLYFVNHLPTWCSYVGLDASGFYDANIMGLANVARSRASVETVDALLGSTEGKLAADSFDACISVSVLEHVPTADIAAVCRDMFRLLKPGAWAIHSIDYPLTAIAKRGRAWVDALHQAGFRLDDDTIEEALGGAAPPLETGDQILTEPFSIRSRFSEGYRKSIWGRSDFGRNRATQGTFLVAAQKPRSEGRV
ncbi:MAG: class I SAM-dependent methyltransferase [Hyphomonadaceae bacterium]